MLLVPFSASAGAPLRRLSIGFWLVSDDVVIILIMTIDMNRTRSRADGQRPEGGELLRGARVVWVAYPPGSGAMAEGHGALLLNRLTRK